MPRCQAPGGSAYPGPLDGCRAAVEDLSDGLVRRHSIGLQREVGIGQLAGHSPPFRSQGEQVRPCIVSQGDEILLGKGIAQSPVLISAHTVASTPSRGLTVLAAGNGNGFGKAKSDAGVVFIMSSYSAPMGWAK